MTISISGSSKVVMICLCPLVSLTLKKRHWKQLFCWIFQPWHIIKGDMFMHIALTLKLQQIFVPCWKEKVNWRKNIQVWWGGDWNYIQCRYWVFGRIFNVSEFTLPLLHSTLYTLHQRCPKPGKQGTNKSEQILANLDETERIRQNRAKTGKKKRHF